MLPSSSRARKSYIILAAKRSVPTPEYNDTRYNIIILCLRIYTWMRGYERCGTRRQPDMSRAIDWPTRRRHPGEDGSAVGPVRRTGVHAAVCLRATPLDPLPDLRHWSSAGGAVRRISSFAPRFRSGVVGRGGVGEGTGFPAAEPFAFHSSRPAPPSFP